MTDSIVVALITGGFGTLTAAITTAGLIISRKARDAALLAVRKVDVVHDQAVENWSVSRANHETLTKVIENTDGNVRRLVATKDAEAAERERLARLEGFREGQVSVMEKKRRASDHENPADVLPVDDKEPSE